jgi:hypothetical protein
LAGLVVSSDGMLLGRREGEPEFRGFLGSVDDLLRNIHCGTGRRHTWVSRRLGRRDQPMAVSGLPLKILYIHGWNSAVGGVKPTYLKSHGHEIIEPALDHDNFEAALKMAQVAFDQHQPEIVVGSSRGGAVAINIDSGSARLVLICAAWKTWGQAQTVMPGTTIIHARADDVVPFEDSVELLSKSGLPESAQIEIGQGHRLGDPKPLEAMVRAVEC